MELMDIDPVRPKYKTLKEFRFLRNQLCGHVPNQTVIDHMTMELEYLNKLLTMNISQTDRKNILELIEHIQYTKNRYQLILVCP